jgi:hypothetical protein
MGKEWDFSPSTPGILDDISDIHFWNPWESPVSGHPASVPWYISLGIFVQQSWDAGYRMGRYWLGI